MAKKKTVFGNNYKNPNGNLTIEEMVKMKHQNKVEEYMRKLNIMEDKCPYNKLKPLKGECFRCIDCLKHAFEQIKEYKKYYKVKKEKFFKEELDE